MTTPINAQNPVMPRTPILSSNEFKDGLKSDISRMEANLNVILKNLNEARYSQSESMQRLYLQEVGSGLERTVEILKRCLGVTYK